MIVGKQVHIVNKVFVDVYTNSSKVAYQFKDNVGDFITEKVIPYLERYFESIESNIPSEIVQIPKLAFDINISGQNNKLELNEESQRYMVKEIQNIIATPENTNQKVIFLNKGESRLRWFLYFLEEGTTPWWQGLSNKFVVERNDIPEIVKSENFEKQFKQKINKPKIRERLINQFSDVDIQLILLRTFRENKVAVSILKDKGLEGIKQLNGANRKLIWQELMAYFLYADTSKLKREFNKIANGEHKNKNLDSVSQEKKAVKIILDILKKVDATEKKHYGNDKHVPKDYTNQIVVEEIMDEPIFLEDEGEDEYFVENAGLLLLHPYLKCFFENCGLLNREGKIINPELAIHLLHYVATKKESQYEDRMVFEKFLCGIPIKQSISRDIQIPKKVKTEVEELLKAVIENWKALKNSSPDLLRNEFLQRPGKLNLKGDNPKLVMERKVQDILLGKLPWNISIFKLPWMDKLIFADW